MTIASIDSHHKKHLIVKKVIHKLVVLALSSCDPTIMQKTEDEKYYVVEAVKILYNLASFDRVRYYIPGETASVSQRRKRFSAWGGLVSLYYLNQSSVLSEVRSFFESSSMKDIQVADLILLRDTLKKLLDESNSAVERMKDITNDDTKEDAHSNSKDALQQNLEENERIYSNENEIERILKEDTKQGRSLSIPKVNHNKSFLHEKNHFYQSIKEESLLINREFPE